MIEHEITLTRAELQDEWDKSCRLVERLTQAVKTLAEERDEARKQRDELLAKSNDLIHAWVMSDKHLGVVPSAIEKVRQAEMAWRETISSVEK